MYVCIYIYTPRLTKETFCKGALSKSPIVAQTAAFGFSQHKDCSCDSHGHARWGSGVFVDHEGL